MNTGTKSLLFGVHQIVWHPITVFLAWCELYGLPNWKELVCIVIHDWGYWGSPNMDGAEGEKHPEYAAKVASFWLDTNFEKVFETERKTGIFLTKEELKALEPTEWKWHYFCLLHSRHYAKRHHMIPSRLCWADKLSIKYDPWWFYLPRAWLSGELKEYRALHAGMGEDFKTHREWYFWASGRAIAMGSAKSSEGISYHPDPMRRP